MEHTEDLILKPTHTVIVNPTTGAPAIEKVVTPDHERLTKMPEHVVENMDGQGDQLKRTVEPTAKLMQKPVVGADAKTPPKKVVKK